MKVPRVSDVVGIINKIAPSSYAEEWDAVGLQIGDPASPAERIMVALDPSRGGIRAAIEADCRVLLTHHPLIFSPLKRIVATDPLGADIALALKHGLAIAVLHTNYDIAAGGVNDLLAEKLGVAGVAPLKITGQEDLAKLSVFVPRGHEEQVLDALLRFSISIGNYRDCSFRCAGTGTFLPLEGATPFVGQIGRRAEVDESRIDVLVTKDDLPPAVAALRQAHPYEEPAFDVYPLLNQGERRGLGRIGVLAEATDLASFAGAVKASLGAASVRFVGRADGAVRKVALCGGSGMSLMREAVRKGADVLVTGDVKYHEAREAEALGLAILDAGHFATEVLMVQGLSGRLRSEMAMKGYETEIVAFEEERDPFSYV